MSRRRPLYQPIQAGWVGISDPHNNVLARIDCRTGGAQQAFEDLCLDLARAGWELGDRSYDWRFVRRGSLRWEIRIGVPGPEGAPEHRGYMTLTAEDMRRRSV